MRNQSAVKLVNVMNKLRCCDEPCKKFLDSFRKINFCYCIYKRNIISVTNSAEQVTNFVAKDQANVELPPRIMSPRNDGPNGLFPYPLLEMQSCR